MRPIATVSLWADKTAATFPAALSTLGDGLDTEDEYNDDVSAPFCSPHLWWKACISGPDTANPVTVRATPSNIPKQASCRLYKNSGLSEMRLMG